MTQSAARGIPWITNANAVIPHAASATGTAVVAYGMSGVGTI